MNKRLLLFLTTCSALVSATASAEPILDYALACKADLGITTPLPRLNCNDGLVFAPNRGQFSAENDYVGYARITDTVDEVFACRWLSTGFPNPSGSGPDVPPYRTAASVEMILHNRQTGHTCFFAAKNLPGGPTGVETLMPAVDEGGGAADTYWMYPDSIDSAVVAADGNPAARLRCVGCHAAGPYIASPRIAPFLARFGLLNNGHDTIADMNAASHFHVFGSSAWNNPTDPNNTAGFKAWDSLIIAQMNDTDNNGRPDTDCSGACHSIARRSTVPGLNMVTQGGGAQGLIPPQSADITNVLNLDPAGRPIQQIMPPLTYSDYRWVNIDTPTNVATGDTGDIETLQKLQQVYPQTWSQLACSSPSFVQAHVVGSDVIYDTSGYADKLHTFNLRDGLQCLHAEQTNSHSCLDYQTRYKCPSGSWSRWINTFTGLADDNELRTNQTVIKSIQSDCGSSAVTAIQAKFAVPGTSNVVIIDGPPDRLAEFDRFGLKCNNGDQGTGQSCSNYVVRYVCNTMPGPSTLNTDHGAGSQQTVLTESTSVVNQGINNQVFSLNSQAQQWIMLPVTDFTNSSLWTIAVSDRSRAVRLKSQWTGFYATSNDVNKGPNASNPLFWLLAQASQPTWTTQIWIKEPIPAPFEGTVRLRTAWVPPVSKSTTTQLYMTLQTNKNNDVGTQDVFIQPSQIDGGFSNFGAIPVDVQRWEPRGVGGPLSP